MQTGLAALRPICLYTSPDTGTVRILLGYRRIRVHASMPTIASSAIKKDRGTRDGNGSDCARSRQLLSHVCSGRSYSVLSARTRRMLASLVIAQTYDST